MKPVVKDELFESSEEEEPDTEDDEEAWKLTDEVEKEFFKTLSKIKSKDPKIYKQDVEFFKDVTIPEQKVKDNSKSAPLTLREYERKIVVEKGGELSDEDKPAQSLVDMSYVEEQRALKDSLKFLMQSDSEYESEAEWGGLFKKRQKTKTEEEKDEEDYKRWLKGQNSAVPDDKVAKELKPLRDFWTNPDLTEEDTFLRDYILNKRFLEADEKGDSGVDVGKLESDKEDDENHMDKNMSHRHEEPDQEFIKRYPRVMENSVRRKDDYRRRKREEIKERKLKEKEKKKAEIRQKQKLKKKEIEQKLEELKKLTGNEKLAFDNVLDKDFDIDEHEKTMQKLFNEEFYSQEDPNFNPNDSAGDEGDWNEENEENVDNYVDIKDEPQCEDPDFNMDCDFDPSSEQLKEKTSRSRRRKDKHRRTTLNEAVKQEKPVFDPAIHKSYEEYLDQYYAIDCEDFIGDLPCRFKYRRTVPNSYGLTIEEILAADPKELERWCSIKRVTQRKPIHREKGEAMSFKKRAENEELKRKILPSLFKKPDEEKSEILESKVNNEMHLQEQDGQSIKNIENSSKKQETKKKNIPKNQVVSQNYDAKNNSHKKRKCTEPEMKTTTKKRKKFTSDQVAPPKIHKTKENNKNNKKEVLKQKVLKEESSLLGMSDARLQAYGIKPKKFKNKLRHRNMKPKSKKMKQITTKTSTEKNIKSKPRKGSKSDRWVISNTK